MDGFALFLEEGLFLTQFADQVTIIQATGQLTGSKLLQEKVQNHPKMRVLLNTEVTAFNSDSGGKLESVSARDKVKDEVLTLSAAGAFIFIGLDPNTAFVKDLVALDDRKFIVTDRTFASNIPGVFAAGDVREGSTKQMASAVGEGAAAAIQIRFYLDAVNVHP